jgi:hypothetical protein
MVFRRCMRIMACRTSAISEDLAGIGLFKLIPHPAVAFQTKVEFP